MAAVMVMALTTTLAAGLIAPPEAAGNRERLRQAVEGVTIKDRLGKYIPQQLTFTDHRGKSVSLKRFFGDKPVLLTLNYYRCKTLCNVQLNQVVKGLKGLEWKPGKNYRIVTVSIDPRESWELAREKRKSYLKSYGKGEVDWTFLVGKQPAITRLANAVGFKYKYDEEHDQYIHVPAIFFLTSSGRLTRYLHGLKYPSRSLKFALMQASEGEVGTVTDKLFMSCFHYDPETGTYSASAFGIMRLAASSFAVLLGLTLIVLWLLDRYVWSKSRGASADGPARTVAAGDGAADDGAEVTDAAGPHAPATAEEKKVTS
jgi:protein SCO1/2